MKWQTILKLWHYKPIILNILASILIMVCFELIRRIIWEGSFRIHKYSFDKILLDLSKNRGEFRLHFDKLIKDLGHNESEKWRWLFKLSWLRLGTGKNFLQKYKGRLILCSISIILINLLQVQILMNRIRYFLLISELLFTMRHKMQRIWSSYIFIKRGCKIREIFLLFSCFSFY